MTPNRHGLWPSEVDGFARASLELFRFMDMHYLEFGPFSIYRYYSGSDQHETKLRVLRTDRKYPTFDYSMQDAVYHLTGDRFDDDAPRFAMLDYLEDRGFIS